MNSVSQRSSHPVKAHVPALAPGVSALAAFKTVAAMLLDHIHANHPGVIEGSDPEYLHQMRVAVRRLRSLLSAYRKVLPKAAVRPLIGELKWLARALGPARDADVFATEIWPSLRAALGPNPLLVRLDASWDARRRAASAKVHRALGTRRYQRFMHSFLRQLADDAWRAAASRRQRAVLDGSAHDFAHRLIERRDAKVRAHAHAITERDARQLHALRIQIKKLRYAVDSFGTLFGRGAVRVILASLSRLQNILGAMNDLEVAEHQVAAALAQRRGRAARALHAALASWRAERTAALKRKLSAAWRGYRRAERL